jgi:hypothetical protein
VCPGLSQRHTARIGGPLTAEINGGDKCGQHSAIRWVVEKDGKRTGDMRHLAGRQESQPDTVCSLAIFSSQPPRGGRMLDEVKSRAEQSDYYLRYLGRGRARIETSPTTT